MVNENNGNFTGRLRGSKLVRCGYKAQSDRPLLGCTFVLNLDNTVT